MKYPEFLFPLGWDTSPSQVANLCVSIHRSVGMLCLAQEHDMVTQQGLKPVSFNPDSRAPTVRLPLPHSLELIIDVHAKLKY